MGFVFLRIYSFHQHPTARKCSIRSQAPVCHVRCRWECDSPTSCCSSCRPSGKPSLRYSHHVTIITRPAVMRLNTSSQFISAKTTHKLSNTLFVSHKTDSPILWFVCIWLLNLRKYLEHREIFQICLEVLGI